MAEFKLVLTFSGLCAFAPREDGKKAWVFLVNEKTAHKDIHRKKLRQHHAILKFLWADSAAIDDKRPETKIFVEADGLARLDFRDIHILPDGKPEARLRSELRIEGFEPYVDPNNLPIPEVPEPSGSFAYLGCLEKAALARGHGAGGGSVLPDLLRPNIAESFRSVLAARVHLNEGDLAVEKFGQIRNEGIVVWRFKPFKAKDGTRDHMQILASSVRLEIKFKEFVRFQILDLLDSKEKATIDLRPIPEPGRDSVTVSIRNEESEQFLPEPPDIPARLKKSRKQDRILESFFKLTRNSPPLGKRPIAVGDYVVPSANGGRHADSSPPCSPVRLSSVPKDLEDNLIKTDARSEKENEKASLEAEETCAGEGAGST